MGKLGQQTTVARGVCDILGYLKLTESKLIFLSEPGSYWEEIWGLPPRRGNAGGTVAMQVHGHAFISSSILLFPFIVRPAFYTRLKRISTDYKQRANQISCSLKDPWVPSPHPAPCHMSW